MSRFDMHRCRFDMHRCRFDMHRCRFESKIETRDTLILYATGKLLLIVTILQVSGAQHDAL